MIQILKKTLYIAFIPLTVLVLAFIMFTPTFFPSDNYRKITLNQMITDPYITTQKNDDLLIFFGYVGCRDVCTPRLSEIAKIYQNVQDKKDIKVLFIALVPTIDPEQPDLFAKYFNENFEGIYLEETALQKIKNEFNVYIAKSLTREDEYDHTANFYLLKKENGKYFLRYIYTHTPFDEALIIRDILSL